jgi:heme/copper-type cytochrome/quinol oxidase subunit 3
MEKTSHAAAASAHHTSLGLDNRKLLWWMFIGSECMFFGSLITTYLVYKGKSLVGPYPHATTDAATGEVVHGILNIPLTSISTFDLLMSSLAMVLALAAVQKGDKVKSVLWLGVTALLGAIFLGFQAYEFTHFYKEGLTLSSNLFGASFFVLTGFHGAHVTVGVIWLVTLMILAARGKIPQEKALNVELAGLYWHFVDVVWIIIFTLIYLIP